MTGPAYVFEGVPVYWRRGPGTQAGVGEVAYEVLGRQIDREAHAFVEWSREEWSQYYFAVKILERLCAGSDLAAAQEDARWHLVVYSMPPLDEEYASTLSRNLHAAFSSEIGRARAAIAGEETEGLVG